MKKYSFILCIALVAFVVASCGLKGNHTSSGRAYELLVVVDHGVWDRAAGRALHDALDADMPGLPQSEPSFRIMYTSPKDYDSTLKLIRNIIIVDIQDIYTKASFKYAKDVYAKIGYCHASGCCFERHESYSPFTFSQVVKLIQISLFCLVAGRFHTSFTFYSQNFCSVGEYIKLYEVCYRTFIFLFHKVAYTCCTFQFEY